MSENKYKKIIELVELVNIELQELNCKKNNLLSPEKRSNLKVEINNDISNQSYDGIELIIDMSFNAVVFYNEDKAVNSKEGFNENVLFEINFILEATYKLDTPEIASDIDAYQDELAEFADRNVPINTWPYAREIISSTSTRMGFPPLIIPTYKTVAPL